MGLPSSLGVSYDLAPILSKAILTLVQGAAAVLEYNTIESPLAQPRNTIFGHVIGTATAVGVVKLFMLNPNFEDIRWPAAGMACGTTKGSMGRANGTDEPSRNGILD